MSLKYLRAFVCSCNVLYVTIIYNIIRFNNIPHTHFVSTYLVRTEKKKNFITTPITVSNVQTSYNPVFLRFLKEYNFYLSFSPASYVTNRICTKIITLCPVYPPTNNCISFSSILETKLFFAVSL